MSTASLSFRGIAPLKRGDRSCVEVTWRSELHVKATLRAELDVQDPGALARSFDAGVSALQVQLDPESKNFPGPTWLESAALQIRETVHRSGGPAAWVAQWLAARPNVITPSSVPRWLAQQVLEHLDGVCKSIDAEERTMLERHRAEVHNLEERCRAAHERKSLVADSLRGTIHA